MKNLGDKPSQAQEVIASYDESKLEELLDESYKLSLSLDVYDSEDVTHRYQKLKKLLPKLPRIAQSIVEKCRDAIVAQGLPDPGAISVYLVGGRTELKHIGPSTDFDLIITFQAAPWQGNDDMSQKLHLASIEVNSAIDAYNFSGEHTILNCGGIGSTIDDRFRKAAHNKDTILLYSEAKT